MSEIKAEKLIEVRDLSFSYGREEILNDITIEIARGDYLGIVGPNGAGKTTLLKIMLGLLNPSKGEVVLFGKNIRHFKDWPKIGYVPQKAVHFDVNFPATVQEVVLMGRYSSMGLFHAPSADDFRLVRSALEKVNMWAYKDSLIGDLSGGEQQRVFIARALAAEPEIIFLDEPTTGVDQKTQGEFYSLLKKLNEEMSLTLVLVSHDIQTIAREVKHIACIDRNLVCYGFPQDFLKDSRLSEFFGGEVNIVTHKHKH